LDATLVACESHANDQQSRVQIILKINLWSAKISGTTAISIPPAGLPITAMCIIRLKQNVPAGTDINNTEFWQVYTPLTQSDVFSTRTKDTQINDAILTQADVEVPLSGYDY
jgi:hypothetical protein